VGERDLVGWKTDEPGHRGVLLFRKKGISDDQVPKTEPLLGRSQEAVRVERNPKEQYIQPGSNVLLVGMSAGGHKRSPVHLVHILGC